MKKIVLTSKIFSLILLGFLVSCSGSNHGELVGVQNRPDFYPSDPYGMVYIPQGSFNAGNADVDVPATLTAPTKTVSVSSFYMDETEITNNEYRQFVHWVRDSILRYRLAEGLVEDYEYISYADLQNPTYFEEYVGIEYPDSMQSHLDWSKKLSWDSRKFPSIEYTEVLETMYLSPEERYLGGRMLDSRQLNYLYFWIDKQKAAKKSNRVNMDFTDDDADGMTYNYKDFIKDGKSISDRSSFFESETINIYPDTLVWLSDFTYSFN